MSKITKPEKVGFSSEKLENITFIDGIGSYKDKSKRILATTEELLRKFNKNTKISLSFPPTNWNSLPFNYGNYTLLDRDSALDADYVCLLYTSDAADE